MIKKNKQNQKYRFQLTCRFGYRLQALVIGFSILSVTAIPSAQAENDAANETKIHLSVYQVLQQVIDAYPSLETLALKVFQAQSKVEQVRGQLDWRMQAIASLAREPGLFLGTSDNIKGSANFSKRMENGDTLNLLASLNRSDSEMSLSPSFPNPMYAAQIKLSYRKPLLRDRGFPSFAEDLKRAELDIRIAQENRVVAYESILNQVIAIFYSINSTVRQVENIHQSLERTKRLKKFIESRLNLGIAENKDILQILAQIDAQNAQLQVLDAALQQQIINLNRLLVNDWNTLISLDVERETINDKSYQENIDLVQKHSPILSILDLQLQHVQNNLDRIRDMTKDDIDLVLFAGAQSVTGDSALGNVSERDNIGGVSVEYKINQSNTTKASLIREIRLYQDMAFVEKKHTLQDIQYDVAELVSGISLLTKAVSAYEKSVTSEKKKLDDAEARYRRGRIDIDRVIGFENQLSAAELLLEIQRIEIDRRRLSLAVLNGDIWKKLKLPEMSVGKDVSY